MEKVVRSIFLTLMILAATGVANAGWTTTVYNTTVTSDVALGQTYTWGSGGVGNHYMVDWQHLWDAPAIEGDITAVAFVSADLSISESSGDLDETVNIHLGSSGAPVIAELDDGMNSIPGLMAADYPSLDSGSLDVYAELFVPGERGSVTLNSSKLVATYEITESVWEDGPTPEPPAIPAPAAIVLGSLGTGLVGWIRRRGLV